MATVHGADGSLLVSCVIKASPQAIYRALLDPQAVAAWRALQGMRARIDVFEPREGGAFRMALEYLDAGHAVPGKTSAHADVVHGKFRQIVANCRVVEEVQFESDDPAFAGTMLLTTTLAVVAGGTEVAILCRNAPQGIRPGDHEIGIRSTLEHLAAFVDGKQSNVINALMDF